MVLIFTKLHQNYPLGLHTWHSEDAPVDIKVCFPLVSVPWDCPVWGYEPGCFPPLLGSLWALLLGFFGPTSGLAVVVQAFSSSTQQELELAGVG